ncbi:replicative DNA helicase [Saccharopolyspora spinosa]|uniref:Replicative DNA helicase n=1 Tax=Saccharopolyspora spinosa TaxID=60894 RepID=A0A2N3XRM1_SACSN|nr:replicative DNA helicase [Saccharopolyspora spinosa]PKW13315.1 replicative DNA helicase [Saccharopolyspora spinosa]
MAVPDERVDPYFADDGGSSGGTFERQPPQDLAAEQSVLGGMMLSKDAIADVVEVLSPNDFYRPAHQAIYDCVLDLYGRGEPADAITVSAELERRQELLKVGGAPYLHTLIATVPTAANAGYYAEIVSEKAILRRLVEAGTRIVQLGYHGSEGAAVEEVVDRAQSAIYDVTERRASEDYHVLEELLQPTMDEIDAIASRGGESQGIPTGFADLDALTNGLHPGQMIIIAARPGVGKALGLDTPLPTPGGWTTMGQVGVGDYLIGADGNPTKVVATTDVMQNRPCYEVVFSDGSVVVADAEHQWKVTTRAHRRQITETKTSLYWSQESIDRVKASYKHSMTEQDQFISSQEAHAPGDEFANTMHRIVTKVWDGEKAFHPFSRPKRSGTRCIAAFSKQRFPDRLDQWITRPSNASTTIQHSEIATTEEIHKRLRCSDGRLNYAVPNAAPLDLPHADLPVPPYMLGAWLGDGHANGTPVTSADPQVLANIGNEGLEADQRGRTSYSMRMPEPPRIRECFVCGTIFSPRYFSVRACSYTCARKARSRGTEPPPLTCIDCDNPARGISPRCQDCQDRHGTFAACLRTLGVLGKKHIPTEYLRASEQQRRALLAGLLDADGTVEHAGSVSFGVTNERLALDVRELIVSLGYRCSLTTKRVRGRSEETSTFYRLNFTTEDEVFRLDRKNLAHQQRRTASNTQRTSVRYIIDVRPVSSVPVRCVEVDAPDHLYLAGHSMIPTHNSTLGLDIARSVSVKHGLGSVIFSLEMGRTEIVMRMLSAEARIRLGDMRGGRMTDDDWTRLARRMSEISEAPLFVDDSPNLTMMEIRAKARRLKQRHDIQLIVLDYMQLMTSGKRVESRQQEVSEFSRNLKLLAKELEVPLIAISQLNRGPEQRTDKRPQLSDLRESGSLEQDADMVILIHRPDAFERDDPRMGEADLILAKHRAGPTATITVAHQLHYSRFVDMAQE